MAHSFGDYPVLAYAIPFVNLSFGAWAGGTYPDSWALFGSGVNASWAKYTPGFDLSRAIKIAETGAPVNNSAIYQSITLPDYIQHGQKTRVGGCAITDLEGAYGAGQAAIILYQGIAGPFPALAGFSLDNSTTWEIGDLDSTGDIDTSGHTNIAIRIYVWQYAAETDPAVVIDCLKAEYGRSITERYYTFTRFPELSGLDIRPMTFRKNDRTGRGGLRSYDPTGGATKWRVVLPFENVPASFVEVLEEFWRNNRGLEDGISRPLCLTHNLTDPTSAHTAGHDYLKRPPWIVCNIVDEYFPFKHVGSWLGAGMYSGSLTFEEI